MKTLTSGLAGLIFAGYIYTQPYEASMAMLKKIDVLMDGAVAQLTVANTGNLPPTQNLY